MKPQHIAFIAVAVCALAVSSCKKDKPNTPAEFKDLPQLVEGTENLPVGSEYVQLQGNDSDGDNFTFSMDEHALFAMSAEGRITNKQAIDVDTEPGLVLETTVTVHIRDTKNEGETETLTIRVINDTTDDVVIPPPTPAVSGPSFNDFPENQTGVVGYFTANVAGSWSVQNASMQGLFITENGSGNATYLKITQELDFEQSPNTHTVEVVFTPYVGDAIITPFTLNETNVVETEQLVIGYHDFSDNPSSPYPIDIGGTVYHFARIEQTWVDGQLTQTDTVTERNNRTYDEIRADGADNGIEPNGNDLGAATANEVSGLNDILVLSGYQYQFHSDITGLDVDAEPFFEALQLVHQQIENDGYPFSNWWYTSNPSNPYWHARNRFGYLLRDSQDPNGEIYLLAQISADYAIAQQ